MNKEKQLIKEISFISPCEEDRLPLFINTLSKYSEFEELKDTEFVVPTRTIKSSSLPNIKGVNYKLLHYSYDGCFNCSMGLNLGVKNSSFNNVVIMSPEVMPISNVVKEFRSLRRGNYVCQVWDENEKKERTISLVNTNFRSETPGFYFLAIYKKEDILAINGWDEDFMGGCAWEDNDFGERFVRSGAEFKILDNVQAQHQYHFRWYTDLKRNIQIYERNKKNKIIKCLNGIEKI